MQSNYSVNSMLNYHLEVTANIITAKTFRSHFENSDFVEDVFLNHIHNHNFNSTRLLMPQSTHYIFITVF